MWISATFCLHCPFLWQFSNVIWAGKIWIWPSLASLTSLASLASLASPKCLVTSEMVWLVRLKILFKYSSMLLKLAHALWRYSQKCTNLPKPFYERNATPLAKFVQVMSKSGENSASGHYLIFICFVFSWIFLAQNERVYNFFGTRGFWSHMFW